MNYYKIVFLKDLELQVYSQNLTNPSKVLFKKGESHYIEYFGFLPINSSNSIIFSGQKGVATNIGELNIDYIVYEICRAEEFYKHFSRTFNAYNNCIKSGNEEWENKHFEKLEELVKEYLPRGSGFDNGTEFIWEGSNENKLVFKTAFHHMNDGGYYDGWTEHKVIITSDLQFGYNIKVTGRNRNDIKDYIASAFSEFEFLKRI